ncbi:hypothetical protein [Lyngbya sp. PCC 8106]|uniref:hypothetical protein n=1 Tax=Lyngbya sp. (strain PCC 8106) TaxID=313612 RepID=UPI0000EAC261|nr:hypothetical protein [Lyngbya sp. PCC 8106]EAW34849.1 hypothetical protein L8106_18387 [Lyngbya sp. PCC 8106]
MHKNLLSLIAIGIMVGSLLFFGQPSIAQPLTSQAIKMTFQANLGSSLLNRILIVK